MVNEKRMISVEKTVKELEGEIYWTDSTKAAIRAFLRTVPAVDAVEVVHGRWEEWWPGISLIMTGEEMLYRCSACCAKYADIEGYKYCPHCGAKMDGERKDNDS